MYFYLWFELNGIMFVASSLVLSAAYVSFPHLQRAFLHCACAPRFLLFTKHLVSYNMDTIALWLENKNYEDLYKLAEEIHL